jgi:6-phosphogluconate dehydrogenase
MGKNLALNLEEKGSRVSVYNRTSDGEGHIVPEFLENEGKGKDFSGFQSLPDFVSSLENPRKILIMVKAGRPVDDVITELTPLLENGDILIDGGNSHFEDTERRAHQLSGKHIRFVGMGVSGGEEGARHGPSLMPGTDQDTWWKLEPLLEPIAAKSFNGSPCVTRVGSGGAGHFVKMVHNGIEYADMQLISEAYDFMKRGLGMPNDAIADQFSEWNSGDLEGYLIEITSDILTVKDSDGAPLVDKILDSAGQKGTGKWTAISAFMNGTPSPGIAGAVIERFHSSLTGLRSELSKKLSGPGSFQIEEKEPALSDLRDALMASRIMCHAEGFFIITETNRIHDWGIEPHEVARIWQGGCIIRSSLLNPIVSAFKNEQEIEHLLQSDSFSEMLLPLQDGWRKTVSRSARIGIPSPVMMSSLSQYDSIRSNRLPANLIQAQRDYFGAHTYERIDQPRGNYFHTNWQEKSSSS